MGSLSRREFLELAARQSVSASIAATAVLSACRSTADQSSALGLDGRSTKTLIALIDEIIPASGDMPAASEVGTLAYFELLAPADPQLALTLQTTVRGADALSRKRFGKGLTSTATTQRGEVLSALAEADKVEFGRLRNYVYEAYYLQPRVWKLLGYDPYPTSSAGPHMAPFDPALLRRVRALPRLYRKV